MNQQPLQGKRILITRAHEQAGALAEPLRALGADVIAIPSIEIQPPQSYGPLDRALKKVETYDWLLLTSVNGVQAMFRRMEKLGIAPGLLRALCICAIGPATQAEIEKAGLKVDVVPAKYVAEAVVEALRRHIHGKRVLLVRAKVARDVIPRELGAEGALVDVVEAYETVLPRTSRAKLKEALADPERRPHIITFTSSSTARNFIALLDGNPKPLAGIKIASIGPVTSETLQQIGLKPDIEASEYTMEGLVRAITYASAPS
jgi:uroporphyrinogen-III synthase